MLQFIYKMLHDAKSISQSTQSLAQYILAVPGVRLLRRKQEHQEAHQESIFRILICNFNVRICINVCSNVILKMTRQVLEPTFDFDVMSFIEVEKKDRKFTSAEFGTFFFMSGY